MSKSLIRLLNISPERARERGFVPHTRLLKWDHIRRSYISAPDLSRFPFRYYYELSAELCRTFTELIENDMQHPMGPWTAFYLTRGKVESCTVVAFSAERDATLARLILSA